MGKKLLFFEWKSYGNEDIRTAWLLEKVMRGEL